MAGTVDPNYAKWAIGVGMVAITWAHAENILALSIGIIDEETGGLAGYAQLPVSLKKRIAYLRKALREKAALQSVAEQGHLLAERFVALKDGRHYLIHGASSQVYGDTFTFLRVSIEGRRHSTFQHHTTLREVAVFQTQVIALADQSVAFGTALAALF